MDIIRIGFINDLSDNNINLRNKNVLIVGFGGYKGSLVCFKKA
jgi:shikimate 5-dehydrogenase